MQTFFFSNQRLLNVRFGSLKFVAKKGSVLPSPISGQTSLRRTCLSTSANAKIRPGQPVLLLIFYIEKETIESTHWSHCLHVASLAYEIVQRRHRSDSKHLKSLWNVEVGNTLSSASWLSKKFKDGKYANEPKHSVYNLGSLTRPTARSQT